MSVSADIRVVHASRSRHPLAIRPANNGAGSRAADGKVMKSPSKNRQARNRQRRQHCKQAKKPHACSRPPARSTGCGHHRRRQQHGGQQEVVNQNNVVSEEQLAALLAAAQLQEVPPPPPPSLVPRSSLVLTVDEQQDGDEMDMEELELDDDPYTAAARACSNGNGVNDEVDDALAHTYTETERELAEHAALHAALIHDKWRICTQRRPQSQHGARQDPQSNEDKAAAANTTQTPAAVDAADTSTEAAIEQPPAPPARDCRRFAAMYERMISPSAQQTPGLVC